MARRKLQQFAENKLFPHLIEVPFTELNTNNFPLKGNWNGQFFKKKQDIVLEIGCGKGEYTVALAEMYPNKNFIGLDIKGNRLWTGAKQVEEKKLGNAGFIRSKADFIDAFFNENEVSEIWLTFSDPQPKSPKRRLSSIQYLEKYRKFLQPNALIHLKTDNRLLFNSTLEVLEKLNIKPNFSSFDLYQDWEKVPENLYDALKIKSAFEQMFLAKKYRINYLNFNI